MDSIDPQAESSAKSSQAANTMFDEYTMQQDDSMVDEYATLSPGSSTGDADSVTTPTGSGAVSGPSTPPGAGGQSSATDSTSAFGSTPSSQSSLSRRGSVRKSTLTQQQKNNKRQRASSEQLAILENEFTINAAPNGKTRLRIADSINMTERSVQIWFQNRRAKIKLLAKKSIETGEDSDLIPDSMKQYLAVQTTGPGSSTSSAYFARAFGLTNARQALGRSASFSNVPDRLSGSGALSMENQISHHRAAVTRLSCHTLTIGTWRRVGCSAMDLVIFYSPAQSRFTYFINNDSTGFKIEYQFSSVRQIYVESHPPAEKSANDEQASDAEMKGKGEVSQELGDIVIVLSRPPQFFMETSGSSSGWFETEDFTEDQQASLLMEHRLTGPFKVLERQLSELLYLKPDNPRQNRAVRSNSSGSTGSNTTSSSTKIMNPASFTTSAPVSPLVATTPSTTPSVAALASGGHGEDSYGFPRQAKPAHLSHRRTRSRSVPAAMDFSYVGPGLNPGFSFNLGTAHAPSIMSHSANPIHPGMPLSLGVPPPHVLAPAPIPSMIDVGSTVPQMPTPELHIDTDSAPFIDMYSYPQLSSATTTPDLSGYHSPAILSTPTMQDMHGMPATPTATDLTGDMVNMNPYTVTNMWVDNTNAYQIEQLGAGQGYEMDLSGMYGNDVSTTSMSDDVVMPDNGGIFQSTFVKPEDYLDTSVNTQSNELLEFGMVGIDNVQP